MNMASELATKVIGSDLSSFHKGPLSLSEILQLQRSAFLSEPSPSVDLRCNRIDRLASLLLKNANGLAEAMRVDFGHRSPMLSLATDVLGIMPSLKHTRKNVGKWMAAQRVNAGMVGMLGGRAWIQWQPLGVVGIISPWNFPVALAVQPLAQAFAAGNRAMIKVSEFTPETGALLQRLIAENFSPDEAVVITGDTEVGVEFSALPFDHLFFTGAPSVGRHILRAAAANLVPVTLELGGKCPVLIAPEANFKRAAARVAFGKTLNSGQLCLSPDYVLVPKGREREFAQAISAAISKLFPTLLNNDDYTSLVTKRHYERLMSCLDDARAKGGDVIEVNPASEAFSNQAYNKLPPTLILNTSNNMRVMQEELFGPVLPIVGYNDIGEAIGIINLKPRPLAAYYFGDDNLNRKQFFERTHSGGAVINDVVLHVTVEDLPFGGIGESGMGAYHGRTGFQTFSHARSIVRAPRFSPNLIMAPPYHRLQKLFGWMLRREVRKVDKRIRVYDAGSTNK